VLGQLMYRVGRRLFDVVLVRSLDCFARSLAELSENVDRLQQQGIRFVAIDGSIDINPKTVEGRSFFFRCLPCWRKRR
jgi:DNA invertase Pin-like site-specific DNA recombinase